MRSELPTGTVTFLFTDIEGSTKLLHELGDAYADALAEHRRVLREAFVAYGGVEVDTQGDAFFVAFVDAAEAVAAAQEGQEALEPGPIRVRMGLHTGEPQLTSEGYVGLAVHEGARIAASAHGGQIVVSRKTKELAGEGFAFSDLGEHRVKDFAEPVWICQLGSERFPPLKTISNTNLPRPASSFVGREQEVTEVVSLLQDGARLLTLSGPGGSGKTRLAIEAAAELVPDFKNGVFWVGLAALRDPALVTETIAQTLGAKDGPAEHIAERELLLLLDNLEQVVDASPELSSLLSTCPNLRLLVTSRELLRIQGEVEYPVPPLAEPEAVELFCSRSRLEPSDEIAELCRRLDDLPLAVELAAARTSVLSPAQILERLSQRLDLLKGGRDAEARQQTLRATIEWSYDLLSEEEKTLFVRLAVFAGGCTLEAAEEVADADLDTLQSLVDKSLLRHTEERFWMLETIREYVLERLEESGEADRLRMRHAGYYEVVSGRALEEIERDHDNFLAALKWAYDAGERERMLRLAAQLGRYWSLGRHISEGRKWLQRALERGAGPASLRLRVLSSAYWLASVQGDYDEAELAATERLELFGTAADHRGVAAAVIELGNVAVARGDFDRAKRLYVEAGDFARQARDAEMLAHSIGNLSELALIEGQWLEAVERASESLEFFRQAQYQDGIAVSLLRLAAAEIELGRSAEAASLLHEALALLRRLGERTRLAEWLVVAASLELSEQRVEYAAQLLAALDRFLADAEIQLEGFEETVRGRTLAAVQAQLDEQEFTAIWAGGIDADLDQIIELALTKTDAPANL